MSTLNDPIEELRSKSMTLSQGMKLSSVFRWVPLADAERIVGNVVKAAQTQRDQFSQEVISGLLTVNPPPKPSVQPPAPSRDWPEDSGHENGSYQNRCGSCGELFIGHKRRVTCKVCAVKPATMSTGTGSELGDKNKQLRDLLTLARMEIDEWLERVERTERQNVELQQQVKVLREALIEQAGWGTKDNPCWCNERGDGFINRSDTDHDSWCEKARAALAAEPQVAGEKSE